MVAYNFKAQFIGPIRAGLGIEHLNERGKIVIPGPQPKRQTIRAFGRRRHARPGEILHLYYGMRTKQCRSIGVAKCVSVEGVLLKWSEWQEFLTFDIAERYHGGWERVGDLRKIKDLEAFARDDGFAGFAEMKSFWMDNHGPQTFEGVLIKWEPIR